jgi:hypothetical protein
MNSDINYEEPILQGGQFRPMAKRPSPIAKRPSPVAKMALPMAKRPSPIAKRPSPIAKRPSPVAKMALPTAKRPSPIAKRPSPIARPMMGAPKTPAAVAKSAKVARSAKIAKAAKVAKSAKVAKAAKAAKTAKAAKSGRVMSFSSITKGVKSRSPKLIATSASSAKAAKAAKIASSKLAATRASTDKVKKLANAKLVATGAASAKAAKRSKIATAKLSATKAKAKREETPSYNALSSLYGGTMTRKHRGGGYQFGPAITHGLINNYGQEVIAGKPLIPDCVAAVKTDTMGFSGPKGLPGLSGGSRQHGGRYGFVSAEGAAVSGPPSMGGLAPMSRIPCEASTPNPLNPVKIGGGAPPLTGASLGGDNQAYYAPTAGYSNGASTWVGSTGSPSLIQTPYEAKSMNPACLKTGGGNVSRKNRRSNRRKSNRR